MRCLAFRAAPHPACRFDAGRRAALGAEPVPCVPIDQRAGFRHDRCLAAGKQRRQAARIDRLAVGARDFGGAGVDREMGAPVVEPEKDQRGAALDRLAPRFDRLPIQLEPIGAAGQRPQFAEGQEAGGRIGEQLADPGGVAPAFAPRRGPSGCVPASEQRSPRSRAPRCTRG